MDDGIPVIVIIVFVFIFVVAIFIGVIGCCIVGCRGQSGGGGGRFHVHGGGPMFPHHNDNWGPGYHRSILDDDYGCHNRGLGILHSDRCHDHGMFHDSMFNDHHHHHHDSMFNDYHQDSMFHEETTIIRDSF